MKTTYISLAIFTILLILLIFIYFVNIPSPAKTMVEKYNLEIK